MKRVLSTVLALVMVMTTFAMLVPNALAATEQNVEAKVLYEENFDDLIGKTPEEILAGANMKDERPQGTLNEVGVTNDGVLKVGKKTEQDAFMILENNDALANGFVLEYDVEFLGKYKDTGADNAISFLTGEGKGYGTNQGRCGWTSQIRYNTNILSSVNDSGWKSPNLPTPNSLSEYGGTMQNHRTAVRAIFDPANNTIKTFVQPYKAELDAWDEAEMASVWTKAGDFSGVFGNDLRVIMYSGLQAAIDNLKVTSLDGSTTIYTEDFDDIQGTGSGAILKELGWKSHQRDAVEALVDKDANGRLVLGSGALTKAAGQEFILVENNEDVKNGFVVEYDFEIPYGTVGGNGFGFHSAKALTTEGIAGPRYGWVSQIRWGRSVLSGAYNGVDSWLQYNNGTSYNNSRIVTLTRDGGAINGFHLAVKAVFDPQSGYVTTYAQPYTGEALTWTEEHAVQKSQDLSAYKYMLDGTVRLVVYSDIVLHIDNIKVTTLAKTPDVYGVASTATQGTVAIIGLIDNEIFTKADAVGYRVTMTKADGVTTMTKDIACNFVYSSITMWDGENNVTVSPGELYVGASHIYALHITGITEDVTISITPYYEDDGIMYKGDTSATVQYTVANNSVALAQ